MQTCRAGSRSDLSAAKCLTASGIFSLRWILARSNRCRSWNSFPTSFPFCPLRSTTEPPFGFIRSIASMQDSALPRLLLRLGACTSSSHDYKNTKAVETRILCILWRWFVSQKMLNAFPNWSSRRRSRWRFWRGVSRPYLSASKKYHDGWQSKIVDATSECKFWKGSTERLYYSSHSIEHRNPWLSFCWTPKSVRSIRPWAIRVFHRSPKPPSPRISPKSI